MKRRNKAILAVCTIAVGIGCVGCVFFSRRFVSENTIAPEEWYIFGEGDGFVNAGIITKLTDRGVVFRLQASGLPESNVVGRIVEASVSIDGKTLTKTNTNTNLSRRSHLILNEIRNDLPVPVDVPGHEDSIEVTAVLEFANLKELDRHRKTITLLLTNSETMHWVSPLEFCFGPIL
ncbi:hypothetical protein P3T73_06840 [Kiritimatiellota bacterium B12222]|nr:hypothetical protein P3T73_06840 [Kiritimatiellota bacterium B12222]